MKEQRVDPDFSALWAPIHRLRLDPDKVIVPRAFLMQFPMVDKQTRLGMNGTGSCFRAGGMNGNQEKKPFFLPSPGKGLPPTLLGVVAEFSEPKAVAISIYLPTYIPYVPSMCLTRFAFSSLPHHFSKGQPHTGRRRGEHRISSILHLLPADNSLYM